MPTVNFGTFSKRRNSTKQPSGLSDSRNVKLKDLTSVDAPTFILTGNEFNYNYASWDNRFYFITDIRSVHNGQTEIDCVLDPLATYKAEILASTQYVSYSSSQGNAWLVDTRLPVLKSTNVGRNSVTPSFFSNSGSYILSVVGKTGCVSYRLQGIAALITMISDLQTWTDDYRRDIENFLLNVNPQSQEEAIIALGRANNDTGFLGNSYENAVNAIRSCKWVPYDGSWLSQSSSRIYLGNYDTQIDGYYLIGDNKTDTLSVNIPWHFSDWRRGYCESVYLYLPFVGNVQLSADSITHATTITIKVSVARITGDISYEVICGNEIIGSYGASTAAEIPIGVNQQSSLGSRVNAFLAGADKTLSSGAASTISPLSSATAIAKMNVNAVQAALDIYNTMFSTNMSCIGGISGSSGAGLDLSVICYTVAHDTIISPSDMQQTMGLPTMKPMQLSGLTGYCQCANAHVEAAAMAQELDMIDAYLNSGFYIE